MTPRINEELDKALHEQHGFVQAEGADGKAVDMSHPKPWPFHFAVAAQVVLLAYLQVIEWVEMFPWNDVRRGNGQEVLDVVIGVVMAAFILATWRRWRLGIVLGLLFYVAWLVLQVQTFWVPYIFGASERWARIHARNFSETVQWLPRWENHLPPDASHFVLQILLVVALIAVAWAACGKSKPHAGRSDPPPDQSAAAGST